MLQGLAVMAMVWLHLFDRYDYAGLFFPLLFIRGIHLPFYFAQLSDFCVMCFAFCSGYAHMVLARSGKGYYKGRIKSLVKLLMSYWVVVIVFSLVSLIAGNGTSMPGGMLKLLGNLSMLNITYNGAWWYMYAYTVLVLFSPLILKAVKRMNGFVLLGIGFAVYIVSYYLRFGVSDPGWLLARLGPFGTTLFEYLIGAVFAHYGLFTRLYKTWAKYSVWLRALLSCIIVLIMLASHTLIVGSLFVAPFTGIVLITLFHFWKKPGWIEKCFLFVGSHSTNIWLTHMFFFSVLFVNFVYRAKYTLLIFTFTMLLTIGVSSLLRLVQRPLGRWIDRFFDKRSS